MTCLVLESLQLMPSALDIGTMDVTKYNDNYMLDLDAEWCLTYA